MVDWLIGRLSDYSTVWLIVRLVDCLIDFSSV